jgi:uncharacterized membrane protein (Fun14 family)
LHSFILNLPENKEVRRKMSSEVLLSNIIPFAGSSLVGYAIGFALKKILKWMYRRLLGWDVLCRRSTFA